MKYLHLLVPTRSAIGILLIALLINSCSKSDDTTNNPNDPSASVVLKNQAYGNGTRQIADIYLPSGRSQATTPVMLVIHGGSWIEGDKTDLDPYLSLVQTSFPNYAVVNMNYRLANGIETNRHPAQMEDIQMALDFINSKSTSWNLSSKRVMLGVSSGAHLAMLFTYAFDNLQQVKAVGSIVGPTNLSDPYYTGNSLFQNIAASYLGKTWSQNPDLHKSVSPTLIVTTTSAPTFMAYGGSDVLVPLSNPQSLELKLSALGIPHQYIVYQQEGHEFTNSAAADALAKMATFVQQHLN